MKITRQTGYSMVLSETPNVVYIICSLFIFIGILALVKPMIFDYPPPVWFGLIFTGAGLFFLMNVEASTIIIDVKYNSIDIERKSILRIKRDSFEISKMKDMVINEHKGSKGGRTYSLSFVNTEGKRIDFGRYSNTSLKKTVALAMEISKFAKIPFDEKSSYSS